MAMTWRFVRGDMDPDRNMNTQTYRHTSSHTQPQVRNKRNNNKIANTHKQNPHIQRITDTHRGGWIGSECGHEHVYVCVSVCVCE